jgi:hypothetical protein
LDQRGYVLLWALFAFVLLVSLATAALKASGTERRLAKAATEWNASFYAAESGLQRAMLLAADSLVGGLIPGDSVVLDWSPAGGLTEYRAVIHRIDNGPHELFLLRSTGRRPGLFGGQTSLNLTFTTLEKGTTGVKADGGLEIAGDMNVTGACRVHANDWLYVSGSLVTNGEVTSSGSVEGNVKTYSSGDDATNLSTQPIDSDLTALQGGTGYTTPDATGSVQSYTDPEPIDQPTLTFGEACAGADYLVKDGFVTDVSSGQSAKVGVAPAGEWAQTATREYVLDGSKAIVLQTGTFCVDGSVTLKLSGTERDELGSAPINMSVVADGFIDAVGNPVMQASSPDGMLFLANGDVRLAGEAALSGTPANYVGAIFSGSQCSMVGNPMLDGSLSCAGGLDPTGVQNLVDRNTITGNLTFSTFCGTSSIPARALPQRAWMYEY